MMMPSVGIIGGADGPTEIFVTGRFPWPWLAAAALVLLSVVICLSNRKK